MERNVPVDKNLKWIFNGEEIDRAVRLWTHGYDMYIQPHIGVVHDYGNARQLYWGHRKPTDSGSGEVAERRIHTLLQIPSSGSDVIPQEDLGPYGLGKQRTLEQYVRWSRIGFPGK